MNENCMSARLLKNFRYLKGVSTFLLILDKKQFTYKISKERRIAIANVVGFDNLSTNLRMILLHLSPKTSLLSYHLPYIQINVLIGRAD